MTNNPVILYVEDDSQSRKMMSLLLKGRMKLSNVTIMENSDGFAERVEELDPKPNAILLDIHMKPHDGFEMLQMLKTMDWARQIPIIALTASVMGEEVLKLKTAGFNGCLAKPIDLDTFPDALNLILSGEAVWRILN